jgi:hypothetical protein
MTVIVSLGKRLQYSVNLLRFFGQNHLQKEATESDVQRHIVELKVAEKAFQRFLKIVIVSESRSVIQSTSIRKSTSETYFDDR